MANCKLHRKKRPIFICIVEGNENKTEINYIECLNRDIRGISIKIHQDEHTDPQGMYKTAKTLILRNGLSGEDRIFILIDDDSSQNKIQIVRDMPKKISLITFVISSPCFENWLVSYFNNPKVGITSSQAIIDLSKFIKGYKKSGHYYDKLPSDHYK